MNLIGAVAWRLNGMGGQCPGAPELKGPPRERDKKMKNKKEKEKKGEKRKQRTKLLKYPDGSPHPIYSHEFDTKKNEQINK